MTERQEGIRDRALLLFLLDTGLRINKALKLKVSDLEESIPIYGKGVRWTRCRSTSVHGN